MKPEEYEGEMIDPRGPDETLEQIAERLAEQMLEAWNKVRKSGATNKFSLVDTLLPYAKALVQAEEALNKAKPIVGAAAASSSTEAGRTLRGKIYASVEAALAALRAITGKLERAK